MIDFPAVRAQCASTIDTLTRAVGTLSDRHDNPATYAKVDLGRIITGLQHALRQLDNTEQILLKGDN